MKNHYKFISVLVFQCCFVFFAQFAIGQNETSKYEIKTATARHNFKVMKSEDFKALSGVEFEKKHFRLVQFYQIPSDNQRMDWASQGLVLTDYLSANTYYATIEKGFSISKLKGFVRSIEPVTSQFKKEDALYAKGIPNKAKKSNATAQFILSYYAGLKPNDLLADLKSKGVTVLEHRGDSYQIDVVFAESQLETVTNLPYVQFIGPQSAEGVSEDLEFRNTTSRANFLNSGANGLNYNGTGVVIGIGETGTFGDRIDLKGRVTEIGSLGSLSAHKVEVSTNATGAGNLNPDHRNHAWGAGVLNLIGAPDYSALYASHNLRYTNHSLGSSAETDVRYDLEARAHDLRIASLPNHLVSYSSGNSGTATGYAPYLFPTWANITGSRKQSKNQVSVGALLANDVVTKFSSRGPMYDGRVVPQFVVEGSGGTSFASPKVIGDFAILAQVYKDKNAGVEPASTLLRAIMVNTADDLGNPGPDYIHGYGKPNLRRAYNIINENKFLKASISNGATNSHPISVPANVKQLRVTIVWPDVAAVQNANPAIVNNLNLSVTDASTSTFNPWVLNSSTSVASISAPATRGVDAINTIEIVTIDNPTSGNCAVNVNGFNVPMGPQTYFMVYEFLYDELQIAFPLENHKFVSGETYYIRWDSYGDSAPFQLSYELNNSGTWNSIITNYDASSRVFQWVAPAVFGGINSIKFKVERPGFSSVSGINTLGVLTKDFRVARVCSDVVDLKWSSVTGATGYKVYRVGTKFMEEVTTNIAFSGETATLTGQSTTASEFYAVSALTGTNESQRTIAIEKIPGDYICASNEWTGATDTDWFVATNWSLGRTPSSTDNIVIPALPANQPLITADGAVCGQLTIDSGASLTMNSASTVTLSVSNDWINNGTFASGIGKVNFVGAGFQEITGTSPTNFYFLEVTKVKQDKVLEVTAVITLNASTPTNPLILSSGTFKLSSNSDITPFKASPSAIFRDAAFWINGGIVRSPAVNWSINQGLLRLSAGTLAIGAAARRDLTYINDGSTLIVEGGILDVTGRLANAGNLFGVVFNQSGGVITVGKLNSTTNVPFVINDKSDFTMRGGTIIVARGFSATLADYLNLAPIYQVTGGTIQIGDDATSINQLIGIESIAPIYDLIVNSFNSPKVELINKPLVVNNNLTMGGGTFDAKGFDISVGGNWTNNGSFLASAGKVTFDGGNQSVTGATTFHNLTLNSSEGLTFGNTVTVNNNLSLISGVANLGTFTHTANTLTLGESGTVSGSWGNTMSPATNKNNTFFAATTGIVNVASCGSFTSWTGTADTSWANTSNWSVCGLPTTTSDVAVNTGTFQPVIASNVAVNSLNIALGASLTLASGYNLTVTTAILNAGMLTLKNNTNLLQTTNATNTGLGIANVERESSSLFRLDYTLWSSPVSGTQTLGEFSPLTMTDRFYQYNAVTDLYTVVPIATPFSIGKGYLIRMPNTNSFPGYDAGTAPINYTGTFTGTPNNGNVTLAVTNGTFNAIGNPYPSTLIADTFITDNGIVDPLYFWRKRNNENQATAPTTSYATYTTAGGAGTSAGSGSIIPNGIIQVGQGFIAKAVSAELKFTNSMRTANNANQILKTKGIERNRVWLNLTNPAGAFCQMMVAYMTGATQGIDAAIDGRYFNDSSTALNSLINNEEFAIQGRSLPFDPADTVPLTFKTDVAGNYTIAIDHADGLFANGQEVYLVDSKTGEETNLKIGSYVFSATAGVDNTRFTLSYQKSLNVDTLNFNENTIVIYKKNGVLHVNSGSVLMNSIEVYDLQGRLLTMQKNVKATTASVPTLKAINQVLIVKITSENKSVVRKKVLN